MVRNSSAEKVFSLTVARVNIYTVHTHIYIIPGIVYTYTHQPKISLPRVFNSRRCLPGYLRRLLFL